MKKAVNILTLISLISVLIGAFFLIIGNNSNQYNKFISDWLLAPMMFLALPMLGHTLSLAVNRDRIKPQIWLAIYGVMMFAFIIVLVLSWYSVSRQTKDLSYAIRKEHLAVTGEAQKVRYDGRRTTSQFCTIDNVNFEITRSAFFDVSEGEVYTVIYLPNTKFVIDMLDENGKSLSKK